MIDHDAKQYGSVFGELLGEPRTMPLGPGSPNRALRDALRQAKVEAAFEGRTLRDEQLARACVAGVWLYHDFLDESHTISQSLHTPEGSYWHAIMHRREPDYSNAKYWFRNVGEHPVYDALGDYDPFAFVDACQRAAREGGDLEQRCLDTQMREWWALFDYCYRGAVGE